MDPFAGLMAAATVGDAPALNDPLVNSTPPTVGGGDIDVNLLGVASASYVPVVAPGAVLGRRAPGTASSATPTSPTGER